MLDILDATLKRLSILLSSSQECCVLFWQAVKLLAYSLDLVEAWFLGFVQVGLFWFCP